MQALGFIETKGFIAAVEAADSAMKAASVSLVGQKWVGGGLVTVILTGDVAAIKSAVDAGTESASNVGEVVSSQIIARPHPDMDKIILEKSKMPGRGDQGAVAPKTPPAAKSAPASKSAPKKKSPGI